MKTLTIPRLTEGAEPLQVTVRKLTPSMINEGHNLCLMYNIGLVESIAARAEEEAAGSLELLNSMASMPALAASMEHAIKQHAAKQSAVKVARKAADDAKAKVLKQYGAIDETRTIVDVPPALDYLWMLAEKIIGNPCYMEICTGIRLDDWQDVDDEDFVRVCEEVYRANIRFFSIKFPSLPKPQARKEEVPLT